MRDLYEVISTFNRSKTLHSDSFLVFFVVRVEKALETLSTIVRFFHIEEKRKDVFKKSKSLQTLGGYCKPDCIVYKHPFSQVH